MKYILIFLVRLYQMTLSPLVHSILGPRICRYEESCSDYAIRILQQKGFLKGSVFTIQRLLSCSPFATIHR